eukprot:891231-Rhodomonas_salina.2
MIPDALRAVFADAKHANGSDAKPTAQHDDAPGSSIFCTCSHALVADTAYSAFRPARTLNSRLLFTGNLTRTGSSQPGGST